MRLLIILLFLSSCTAIKNNHIKRQTGLPGFPDANKLYIVCRATVSKSALIAQKFNLQNRKITHCGIGFSSTNGFKIYNITDAVGDKKSALVIDSYSIFSSIKGVNYVGIWELDIPDFPVQDVRDLCSKYQKKKIFFDYDFKIGTDTTLYCSEFCASVLNKVGFNSLHFEPSILKLEDNLYKSFLKRDTLVYFPVDFFQKDTRFKKIYECEF